jgi:hypothetical protein
MRVSKIVSAFVALLLFTVTLIPFNYIQPEAPELKNTTTVISESQYAREYCLITTTNTVVPAAESKNNFSKRFFRNAMKVVSGFDMRYEDNGFSFFTFYISQNCFIRLTAVRQHLVFGILLT